MGKDVETLLSRLSPDDALAILRRLAHEDDRIAERLGSIVEDVLAGVDIDDVAEAVFFDLDTIDIEKIWDRSGMKGVWRFRIESSTQYKEWCEDAPQEFFHRVLDEWREGRKDQRETREMKEYIRRSFPEMAKCPMPAFAVVFCNSSSP